MALPVKRPQDADGAWSLLWRFLRRRRHFGHHRAPDLWSLNNKAISERSARYTSLQVFREFLWAILFGERC